MLILISSVLKNMCELWKMFVRLLVKKSQLLSNFYFSECQHGATKITSSCDSCLQWTAIHAPFCCACIGFGAHSNCKSDTSEHCN